MTQGAFILLASLFAPQAAGEGPVARWAFDGDVKDSGPSAIPTQAVGRLEFIDSPIGGFGKMAGFNGVDARVEMTPPSDLGIHQQDFTLCGWFFLLDLKPTALFHRPEWSLKLHPDGILGW